MLEFPLYNTVPACTKCGTPSEAAPVHYHKTGVITEEAPSYPCDRIAIFNSVKWAILEMMVDHFCRICPTCGYGWIETPLDQAPQEPKA